MNTDPTLTTHLPVRTGLAGPQGPVPPRWRRPMAVVAIASLAAVGLVAAPAQAQVVECAQRFENTTIHGSVQVPEGKACHLVNVVVVGDADVAAGADLLMERTVVGEVTAAGSAFVFADGSVVASGVTLSQSFGLQALSSMIFDGVQVSGSNLLDNTLFFGDGSNIVGNVSSKIGWTVLRNGMVSGRVDTTGDRATDLIRMRVSGVTIDQATEGTVICDTTNDGDFWVTNSHGFVQLGGPLPKRRCAGNNLVGDLQVHDNSAEAIQISGNLITGDARCTGNTPDPVGHGNIILGTASGQCADIGTVQDGVIPPPGAPGETEAVTEGDRLTEITELLVERLAAARAKLAATTP